jgi:hypothetical protein
MALNLEVGWKKWTPKFGKIINGGVTYEKCPEGKIHEGISRGSQTCSRGRIVAT